MQDVRYRPDPIVKLILTFQIADDKESEGRKISESPGRGWPFTVDQSSGRSVRRIHARLSRDDSEHQRNLPRLAKH